MKFDRFLGACRLRERPRSRGALIALHSCALIVVVLLLAPRSVFADTTVINFEGLSDGTILTNQYLGLSFSDAIVLTAGISLNEFEFPPHSGTNVASDNGGPISINFSSTVQSFGGYFTYAQPVTLDAFGMGNNLLTSVTSAFSSNEALSGALGSSPNEFLQVSSSSGISTVTITGDPAGASFALDDATYTTQVAPVLEPSTMYLSLVGAMAALLFGRKIKRVKMPKQTQIVTFFSVIAFVAVFDCVPSSAATSLNTAYSLPASITPNTQYTLTVFVTISDPTLIPQSVNLLRLSIGGSSVILGQLHDDGKNGDLVASDGVYTIQIPVNEPSTGQIQLQISAAFAGQLRRVLSPVLAVPVTSDIGLPPDPGVPGTTTLAGIDSDGDGVRDDVQRYIALTYPDSARTRAALTDGAKALQSLVIDANNPQQAIQDVLALGRAFECSIAINGLASASDLLNRLRAQVLNTLARTQAYLAADSQFRGQIYKLSPPAQQAASCTFNPVLLAN